MDKEQLIQEYIQAEKKLKEQKKLIGELKARIEREFSQELSVKEKGLVNLSENLSVTKKYKVNFTEDKIRELYDKGVKIPFEVTTELNFTPLKELITEDLQINEYLCESDDVFNYIKDSFEIKKEASTFKIKE